MLFCTSLLAEAQQLIFDKEIIGTSTQFKYKFKSTHSKSSNTLEFGILTSQIDASYRLIPNLNTLRVDLQSYFNEKALAISKPYIELINTSHKKKMIDFNERNNAIFDKGKILLSCDNTEPVSFKFTYNINGSYQYNFKTYSCSVSADTKLLWKTELERIKDIVNNANTKLKYGSKIELNITKNNYDLKSTIKAPNQNEIERMKKIIQDTFLEIEKIKKSFNTTSRELQAQINSINSEISLLFKELRNNIAEVKDKISDEFEQILVNKFKEYYFLIENINNKPTILLDFYSIINQSISEMKKISSKLYNRSLDTRDQISKILVYLQTIPYNTLQGREIEGYLGYLPPLALIDKNKGDCDSKSVAIISLLKNIYPDINALIVLIKEHAFVAVEIPKQEKDISIKYKNKEYVVLEPVGPATVEIGKASPQSLRAIQNVRFEKIFAF